MRRSVRAPKRQRGQALVEYAFLFVLLATISIAVVLLAGEQLKSLYQNISDQFTHLAGAVIWRLPRGPAEARLF